MVISFNFRLLLRYFIKEKGLFEGKDGFLYFSGSIEQVEAKSYMNLGTVFAWSVLHGGPGLHCLMPEVYQLMLNNEPQVSNCLDGIIDSVFVENVTKVGRKSIIVSSDFS